MNFLRVSMQMAKVYIAKKRKQSVKGDKMASRHGNKEYRYVLYVTRTCLGVERRLISCWTR